MPFGRCNFNRLHFGVTLVPEHFQRRMLALLRDFEGVICFIDNILIYGNTQEEHDEQLLAVLNRLEEAGLTLNREKCEFSWREVKFLLHILSQDGVRSDPDQVSSIVNMKEPMTVKELTFSGNDKSTE